LPVRRLRKIALWAIGIVVLIPVLVLAIANTAPGQRLIAAEIGKLTGGTVRLSGLTGRFPDALRLARLDIADAHGTWLTAEAVTLDWSPTALLTGHARIDRAVIAHLTFTRLPIAAPTAKPATPHSSFTLPVAIDLRSLTIARADIGSALAGAPATMRLTGHATIPSLQAGTAALDITRLDAPGAYHADGVLSAATITAHITLQEPPHGLLANLANLPALGPLAATATLSGPRTAERAHVAATAGPLTVTADGVADLPGQTGSITLAATAPAMRPRADLAWQVIDLHAHVTGSVRKPEVTAHLAVTGLLAGGAALPYGTADVNGDQGRVALHAILTGLRLPGPKPGLFAAAPLDLTGAIRLDEPTRPVRFRLTHSLLTADGTATTAGAVTAQIHTVVPDIAPIAAIGAVDLQGRTEAIATLRMHHGDTDVAVTGTAGFTGGQAPIPTLLGPTRFSASATLAGQNITIHNAGVQGRAVTADVKGSDRAAGFDLAWRVAISDLSAISPQVLGALTAVGQVSGPTGALTVTADVTGDAGSPRFAKAPVTLTLRADHVPAAPQATIQAHLRVAGAPATLQAAIATDQAGAVHLTLPHADWKSLRATAELALAKGATLPTGTATIRVARLADLAALAGVQANGAMTLTLRNTATEVRGELRGTDLEAGPRRIASLSLTGAATGVHSNPDLRATMALDGIDANGVTGSAQATATGRQAALQLHARAALQNVMAAPATVETAAQLNVPAKTVTLQALTADWKKLALRLQAPAKIRFAPDVTVDRLRLAVNQAQVALAGRINPTLDVTAAVRNVTPDLARAFAPSLQAAGLLTADARVTGTAAAPFGTVRVAASGLRLRTGPGAAIPPASITASLQLHGTNAALTARADAGPKLHLAATGTVPLAPTGALAVQTTGGLDLSLFNPVLEAGGREASGHASVALAATGSLAAPQLAGTVTLAGGEVQDDVQGVHLTQIAARLDAAGDTLRITRFTANAAPGTVAMNGTVGALAPGLPVDLRITARNAKPLASDLLTAQFDADLTVRGHAAGDVLAEGRIALHRVDINVPDSLPPSVAVLHVRRPGDKPPLATPDTPAAMVRLNLTVDAPSSIFVRGHGLDVELGGKLTVGGSSAAPQIGGGFQMRRGDFSLAGTTLTFTKGDIGFEGEGLAGKIDPTLDFEADSYANSITATLKVTGYADAPKIALSSVPDLPQDEVLAHLLFGESVNQLSAVQLAEIGAALAELSGITGGSNPLEAIRKNLGLDRLNVGTGTNGTGTAIEAGRYVAKGVYVGAKQDAGGAGGTQAQVQVDLTRHLKLQTTLGTGGGTAQGATPQNDPGSSVGLSYQFEY
jgi:translocation and assembly module TamB